ncbi:DUF3168 domain-containing protein [Duganella sp. FT92W]|uniref:DUF3168 domain-containing protein n=1 Tax=Pseudoduganella rivuli TaxID=2666085 RepID=A0A7X2LRL3_9BURK|nr:DUF3168 domain-containing protein [Pseudoduganella rivuli]MRV72570.1 DUF3168 domain-containing protein [Pseudoduganella rivuli]
MSDIKAMQHLLAGDVALTAVVPAARIVAGTVPQKMALPAVSITHISADWRKQVSGQSKYCHARVQVMVTARSYPQKEQILRLVRAAVPRRPGTVAGVAVESILRDQEGADLDDDEIGIFARSQDFIVAYNE